MVVNPAKHHIAATGLTTIFGADIMVAKQERINVLSATALFLDARFFGSAADEKLPFMYRLKAL